MGVSVCMYILTRFLSVSLSLAHTHTHTHTHVTTYLAFAKVKYREEATKLFEAHGLVYEWSLILEINFALCAVGRTAHDAAVFFDPTSLTVCLCA